MNVMHIMEAMKDLRFYPTCPAKSFMDLAENMKLWVTMKGLYYSQYSRQHEFQVALVTHSPQVR